MGVLEDWRVGGFILFCLPRPARGPGIGICLPCQRPLGVSSPYCAKDFRFSHPFCLELICVNCTDWIISVKMKETKRWGCLQGSRVQSPSLCEKRVYLGPPTYFSREFGESDKLLNQAPKRGAGGQEEKKHDQIINSYSL